MKIIVLTFTFAVLITQILQSTGNAFFKKPWDDLEIDYLKEVVSSDLSYFDGDWNGELKCSSISTYPGFIQYRKFTIKSGRGEFRSSVSSSRQSGYRYWEIKIDDTGKTSIKGEYYADALKGIRFSGQIGIDPESYYREVMWLRGSRGPRSCECKFDREVPLISKKALVHKFPMYANQIKQKEEEKAQQIAKEKQERERKKEETRRLAENENEKRLKKVEAELIAAKKALRKSQEEITLNKAIAFEASFNKKTRYYLQYALQQLGHYRGKVDGVFGPGTRKAIKKYQRNLGKPTIGYLTEDEVSTLIVLGKVVFEKEEIVRKHKKNEAQRLAEEKEERMRQEAKIQSLFKKTAERKRKEAEPRRIGDEEGEQELKEAAEPGHQKAKTQKIAEERVERKRKEAEASRNADEETKKRLIEVAERWSQEHENHRIAVNKAEGKRKEAEARRIADKKTKQKLKEAAERKRIEAEARRLAEKEAERERKQAEARRIADEEAEQKLKEAAERKRQETEGRKLAEKKAERQRNNLAKSGYDFLLKDKSIQNIVRTYEKDIKTSPIIMDYLNAIISSPTRLYNELVEHDCDKEILKFVKENKSFTKTLVHIRLILAMNDSGVKDNELIFVTNYIKSPTALAATNQQEMGMETALMRGMVTFKLYEMFTTPGGFKDQVETMFHSMKQTHMSG